MMKPVIQSMDESIVFVRNIQVDPTIDAPANTTESNQTKNQLQIKQPRLQVIN